MLAGDAVWWSTCLACTKALGSVPSTEKKRACKEGVFNFKRFTFLMKI
jgi:hypothetical protein